MGLDVDRFGHCIRCHKNMLTEQVIDSKPTPRFTPEYDETEYLLDDGSRMRVAVCKTCKSYLKDSHYDEVMKCVINGWQEEVNGIQHWDKKKRKDYMDIYSKKKIILQSEGVPNDIVDKCLKEHHKKREKWD